MINSWLDLNTVNLLGRIDSRIDKQKLINVFAKEFGLGKVYSFRQIHEGFEDYNVKLKTAKNTYLVKFFSQYKSFRHIKDNVNGLVAFHKSGVKVPKIYKSKKGKFIYYYEDNDAMVLGCVMEFFQGKSFYKCKKEPSKKEIKSIIKEIYKVNITKFKPKGIYDVWVLQNLVSEFDKKSQFLTKHDYRKILPIVKKAKELKYSGLTKGVIHNDIQRSNVLKDKNGNIRIIDFSVMEYNAISIELATFIALFCINPMIYQAKAVKYRIKFVLEEYQKYRRLNKQDILIIPDFIKATYAANCLAGSFELSGKGNNTEETKYWIRIGSRGIDLMNKL